MKLALALILIFPAIALLFRIPAWMYFTRGNRAYDRLCRQIRYFTYPIPSAINAAGTSNSSHQSDMASS